MFVAYSLALHQFEPLELRCVIHYDYLSMKEDLKLVRSKENARLRIKARERWPNKDKERYHPAMIIGTPCNDEYKPKRSPINYRLQPKIASTGRAIINDIFTEVVQIH